MRERLDCAMISTDCTYEWMSPWSGRHWAGKLYFHSPIPSIDAGRAAASQYLVDSAMLLRRYDVCLIPVSETNLGWARTSLLAARGRLNTPVVALVGKLKAAALNDLYELGLNDFIREPLCPEELRVRIERLLDERRLPLRQAGGAAMPFPAVAETAGTYRTAQAQGGFEESALCSSILERTGLELDAYAAATASRSATSRESFRAAKSKIIERFETAYIKAALGRHSGNIAMAARSAQKHRRAFWALMRKYDIDAAPYRSESPPKPFADG
ncbi:MAG TPA: hypothetical protein VL003_05155 [Pusillimonas sp.]|uniref:hypothetical protein n=1 Tax=Pusillimonas sp. TaxID=3040095 RepID=UPI002C62261B|nr:hypothetical protein [Pusillimonas sp.]HUH87424.1 hypothetical protein [Pusillimonas sp.]